MAPHNLKIKLDMRYLEYTYLLEGELSLIRAVGKNISFLVIICWRKKDRIFVKSYKNNDRVLIILINYEHLEICRVNQEE